MLEVWIDFMMGVEWYLYNENIGSLLECVDNVDWGKDWGKDWLCLLGLKGSVVM